MTEFLASEARKNGRISRKNGRNRFRPQLTTKNAKKPKFKDIFRKVKEIKESSSFEAWLENLQGPMSQGIREHATTWSRSHHHSSSWTRVQMFTLVAFIISSWHVAAPENVGDLVVQEMRNSGEISTATDTHQVPAVNIYPSLTRIEQRKTGSERREEKKIARNERLKTKLSALSAQREQRLPVSALESLSQSKWLMYMIGTLRDDDQYLELELSSVKDLLIQVYELVDADSDGAGDGNTKRKYMAPILEPVIYDLTVEALKADWAFVNATFHVNIYGDRSSKQMQNQRARKVARALFTEADVPYRATVVDQIVININQDPERWHSSVPVPLSGRGIVKFLRRTTKGYVRAALKAVSKTQEHQAMEALHTAAVIDASLSGSSIQTRLSETASIDGLGIGSRNPMRSEIINHYRRFLREQSNLGTIQRHAVNALIVKTMESPDKVVRDVKLLWSVFDQSAKTAFHQAEKHKYESTTVQFLDSILSPFREESARNEGHLKGMNYLNNLLHGWANKLLVTMLIIVGIYSKVSSRRCIACSRKGSKSTSKRPSKTKEKIVSMDVYKTGNSNKLWIADKNKYNRISTRGHPDYYQRIREQKSKNKVTMRKAGHINEHGHYEPSFSDDTNININ